MTTTMTAIPKRTLSGSYMPVPATNMASNLALSAQRYPAKTAIVYYGTEISFAQLWRDVEALAGYLERIGVKRGDRVVLYAQNSPQWVVAFYAILRANAVVVPLNPMLVSEEIGKFIDDSGATVAFVGSEIAPRLEPYLERSLRSVLVMHYADALTEPTEFAIPPSVTSPVPPLDARFLSMKDAIAEGRQPGPLTAAADDIAVLPYTSGTTGVPKGCVHTHRSCNASVFTSLHWAQLNAGNVSLSALPYFHVTGMMVDMNVGMAIGGTVVIMTRWDSATALELIKRYEVTQWTAIATMVVDFLSRPDVDAQALRSMRRISGGGAPLPAAVSERLFALTGLRYLEGYGLSETIATTHANPEGAEKTQCLGVPTFNVLSLVVDPTTFEMLPTGEVGEIITSAPQVMRGYWNKPALDAETFVERDGHRYLRTGDLGYVDDEGYFFMVDRLKRMINASGFKVWPAEVETSLFGHPAVREACVIGTVDPRRGETTKALIVLREGVGATAEEIIAWAKTKMSAYKVPTVIEFVKDLPRGATGKVAWRELQEAEYRRTGTALASAP